MKSFIKPIKLKVCEDHNIFFISDTHFNHNRAFIYEKRGYTNIFEHDANIIDRWNKKVTNADTVIHCGDFMFGEGGLEKITRYFESLNFKTLILLPGNHHAGLKQWIDAHGIEHLLGDKEIYIVPNYIELIICGQPIVVCHYPISSWNGMAQKTIQISGHCHNSFPGSQLDNKEGKILDVGIETVKEPQSFAEIMVIMSTKSIKLVDHHNTNTSTAF